jgi:DNA-binding transcriptional regulator YhcF (GntR family)
MKLWLSKSSEVPLHEQLITQLILGMVSADLVPGEQLPSTGELGRRFQIHPNTVRAAYRELVRRGWAEWKQGSGYYVRALTAQTKIDANTDLDHLISTFFKSARDHGFSLKEIQSRISRWFSLQPPDHIVVIDPDAELRKILVTEISNVTTKKVVGASIDDAANVQNLIGAFCFALYDSAEEIRPVLPPEISCTYLHSQSVPEVLESQPEPDPDTLFTIISRWPDFLHWSRTTLISVGISADTIELRDAKKKGWERGLNFRKFIITDSFLVHQFPKGCNPKVFPIISHESLEEIRLITGSTKKS